MLKRYAIKWQYLEPLREYHPPFSCLLLTTTSRFGFGVANLLLQPYGEDRYAIKWQYLEPLREYHPPFSCLLLTTTSRFGFGVANLLLQPYGED